MKKLILILAILVVASPAFALDVNMVKLAGNQVQIRYTGADVNNLPRGFALAFEVNSTADVCGIGQYKSGESVAGTDPCSRGFGIYPATIVIEANIVTGWGSPLADKNDPLPSGADQILPSKNFVLEFGSLYAPPGDSVNAPGVDGNLCVLSFEPNGATSLTFKMYSENVYRGGVVLEDGTTADVNKSLTLTFGPPLPGKATVVSPGNDTNNIARDANMIWTAGSDANSHRVFFGPNSLAQMVFKVEQAGTLFDPNTTPGWLLTQGMRYYWRIDEKNATGTTTGDVWTFRVQECYKSTDPNYYSTWILTGRPSCWCFKKQCRGDGNGSSSVNKPVTAADLTNFKAGFNKHMTILRNSNVVDQYGVPGVCGDYNRTSSVGKPVTAADLTIFKAYYNKANTPGVVPDCASTHINFWTN